MSLNTTTVHAASITEEDRRRAEDFIASDENSPLSIFLQRVLAATARGVDIDLVAEDAELSPNQAAGLLKMSRPHLVAFMDRGELPFRRVGSHRRIKMSDLREFVVAREAGAEIVANAVSHSGSPSLGALSQAERDELNSL